MAKKKIILIISASSDIGYALSKSYLNKNNRVIGTFRTESPLVKELVSLGMRLFQCDLDNDNSVQNASKNISKEIQEWDVLIFCPGNLEPIGKFHETSFHEWSRSIKINFTNQLQLVYNLLPIRNIHFSNGPIVIFFAGGGSNSAPTNYSAYTVSKIALTKMCELLDAEMMDTRFTIVGPGWVKTKIHEATINAGNKAGINFEKTKIKLQNGSCTPMKEILDCFDWLIATPRKIISGRNFSVVFDKWGSAELEKKLCMDMNIYKLRRYGNDI